jgi:UDP-N-acetylmuramoyl-tripeptide--D-alanyl-D-alanine ligase
MDIHKMKITIRGRLSEYSGVITSVGKPGAYNAVAAVAVAEFLKVEPDKIHLGLSGLHPPNMRGQVTEFGDITLWNDTYNANPRAVELLLDIIRQLSKFSRKIVVLGDMLELGNNTEKFHREIGEKAAGAGLDVIITVGPASRVIRDSAVKSGFSAKSVHWFEGAEEAACFLSKLLEPGDLVAIKGSRGLKLEKIVNYLQETAA